MDQHSEYEARGARPRRHVQPPARYADYDVDQLGYISQRYREDVETLHQEGRARLTPFTPTYDSSTPSCLQRRDATPQDMSLFYGNEGLQHIQENQLAPLLSPENSLREQLHECSIPLHPALQPSYPPEDIRTDLKDIRQERHLLQQAQRRM